MDVLDLHPAVAVPGPDSAVFVVPPDHVRLNFGEALLPHFQHSTPTSQASSW
jgi:hypothetical protein